MKIETFMGDPEFYKNGDEAKRVSHEYQDIQKRLTDAYYSWNKVTEEITSLETAGS